MTTDEVSKEYSIRSSTIPTVFLAFSGYVMYHKSKKCLMIQNEFYMIKYYVRVSTVEQKLDRELLAYDKADIVYSDKVSGKDKERPQLKVMLEGLQKDDVVVVKSLDRLSRSTMDLFETAKEIEDKGATLLKVLD